MRRLRANRAGVVTLLIAVSWGCSLGDEGERLAVVPDSRQLVLASSETGRDYQIQIALPREYESSSASFPVVFLLDANGQFGLTTETVRNLILDGELPDLIVVGVGYPVGQFYHAVKPRALDLSPQRDTAWERGSTEEQPRLAGIETGGADAFLRFLLNELIPWAEDELRVDRADRTLIGHSFGGLFTIHALLTEPGAFKRYLSISPSLWWGCDPNPTLCWGEDPLNGAVMRREAVLAAAGETLPGRLYMVVGEDELPHMVIGPQRLADRFSDRDDLALVWKLETLPGETHMSVVGAGISRGLRWLFLE